MAAISQGLSTATPLVNGKREHDPTRGRSGGLNTQDGVVCWHSSGMLCVLRLGPGGVARASLNHRLIAVNPPGSKTVNR